MILWQDGSATAALQFYQLMGSHGVASVFTTSAWLAAEGGNVRSLPYPGSLNWRRQPLAGGVAYEFTVDPPTTGGYAFGFALDPDLGADAADDASGYDQGIGLVYATDAAHAIGFMIRSGNVTALASAVQYGTRRFAPASAARLAAQSSQGVDLLSGRSDVQFVMLSQPATGTRAFRLIVLEAETVAELPELAHALD